MKILYVLILVIIIVIVFIIIKLKPLIKNSLVKRKTYRDEATNIINMIISDSDNTKALLSAIRYCSDQYSPKHLKNKIFTTIVSTSDKNLKNIRQLIIYSNKYNLTIRELETAFISIINKAGDSSIDELINIYESTKQDSSINQMAIESIGKKYINPNAKKYLVKILKLGNCGSKIAADTLNINGWKPSKNIEKICFLIANNENDLALSIGYSLKKSAIDSLINDLDSEQCSVEIRKVLTLILEKNPTPKAIDWLTQYGIDIDIKKLGNIKASQEAKIKEKRMKSEREADLVIENMLGKYNSINKRTKDRNSEYDAKWYRSEFEKLLKSQIIKQVSEPMLKKIIELKDITLTELQYRGENPDGEIEHNYIDYKVSLYEVRDKANDELILRSRN
jgi:hypothetical protein